MLANWSRSTSMSPKRSYSTARHDGGGVAPGRGRPDAARRARAARRTARCRRRAPAPSARSVSQEVRKPRQSYRKEAVGANTWMSPVQPEPLVALRAVGGHVEEVAAQAPDHVLVQPVDQRRAEQANQPVRSMSLWTTCGGDRRRGRARRASRRSRRSGSRGR